TPPRIDAKSIDYSKLTEQPGSDPAPVFSFMGSRHEHPRQVCCHITHTNRQTHDIIRDRLSESAIYSGAIDSVGPRYCPRSKTRSYVSPTRTATRSLSSRKD